MMIECLSMRKKNNDRWWLRFDSFIHNKSIEYKKEEEEEKTCSNCEVYLTLIERETNSSFARTRQYSEQKEAKKGEDIGFGYCTRAKEYRLDRCTV